METRPANLIWETVLGELELQVSRPNYRTWLEKTTGVSLEDDTFIIGVPNAFVAEYLDKNQRSLIEKTLNSVLHRDIRAVFTVATHDRPARESASGGVERLAEPVPAKMVPTLRLSPAYTFDNFIEGNSNRMARAAALEVARNPGKSYNPLFIYGGVGLGKTHLLQAIGHFTRTAGCRVLYASGEEFTNEFVSAIQAKAMPEFRLKYRSTDILLIDDVQFLGGKEQTEECFFHTFNELHDSGRQIVLTADSCPKAMPHLAERLRSRFEWGLAVDIRMPDTLTRRTILESKAKRDGVEVGQDVLDVLAEQVRSNIRELEGSLNRVLAYARLLRAELTPELAEAALKDIGGKKNDTAPNSPAAVIEAVAANFQLEAADILGRKRDKEIALAREVAMYLLRKQANYSLSEIGREVGGRHPSTVSHAYEKIENAVSASPYLKRKVREISEGLYSRQKERE
jgi:chromosomal replication initiator protein